MSEKTYDIGACQVFFKGPSAQSEVDLGDTSGGVSVKISTTTQELEVDQKLDPVDEVMTKRVITVSVPLAAFNIDNLKLAFPGSEIVTDATTSTKKKLLIQSATGDSMISYAGQLRLHPVEKEATDKGKDWLFPYAAPVSTDLEISFTKDGMKTIPVEFKAYPAPSTDTSYSGKVLVFGDPSATAGA